jgi:hypothetical protein
MFHNTLLIRELIVFAFNSYACVADGHYALAGPVPTGEYSYARVFQGNAYTKLV